MHLVVRNFTKNVETCNSGIIDVWVYWGVTGLGLIIRQSLAEYFFYFKMKLVQVRIYTFLAQKQKLFMIPEGFIKIK